MKRLRFCFLLATLTLWLVGCSSTSSTTDGGDPDGGQSLVDNNSGDENTNTSAPRSNSSDFETFFNESLVGRNNDNIEDAVKALIHPDMGVFLIYKPGAIQRPTHCKTIQDLKDIRPSIVDEFTGIKSKAQKGELPFYDCDFFDKKGTYYMSGEKNGMLVSLYHEMEEMLSMEANPEELAAAQKADDATTVELVNTESFLQMSFGQVEGKWYILSIDIAVFDCGA